MKTAAFAPVIRHEVARTAMGRRAAASVGLLTPVINMGLEEIQKQAKAS